MAVEGPWVGWSARVQTGDPWMGGAAQRLRMGIPFWMSNMIGRSVEVIHTLGADHNFNGQWFRDRCFEAGSAPIVFNITGNLVSYSRDVPLFFMYGDTPNEYVQLNIGGGVHMWGRGGQGGWTHSGGDGNGQQGGHCIQNDIGGRLRINNGGVICGGGGGGGGIAYRPHSGANWQDIGGGGGRPFGPGGGGGYSGGAASYDGPGGGYNYGNAHSGQGGDAGANGQNAWYDGGKVLKVGAGGAAGYAVIGSAPTWQNVGVIYGPRV
ncbi:receptor-recognizing protein [Salmonella enterica]|uniref:Receptor-recognizing protein gp38 n=1 Tax=Escherichia phage vB_EcoM-Sa45lw TaxID=2589644 RepID=A0A4Y6EKI2_9CAUD|nr:receptor-recognizing protein [Salmonella enterica]EHY3472227.1 receptor-recognizing protein [Salmonella enterica]EJS9580665.1 receptor-recognizing protein [Salmonella enterica]QDF15273.1 tail fiber adhesin [Escherichia phage vB_EcoM-Sa45lw]